MCTIVLGEVAFLVELFITNSTLKRFVARMDAFVFGEIAFVLEAFIAERTLVRSFSRTCSIRNGDGILIE